MLDENDVASAPAICRQLAEIRSCRPSQRQAPPELAVRLSILTMRGIGKTPYQRLHEVQKQMHEALCPLLFGKQGQLSGAVAQASSDAA